jgi:hypothetical protein
VISWRGSRWSLELLRFLETNACELLLMVDLMMWGVEVHAPRPKREPKKEDDCTKEGA